MKTSGAVALRIRQALGVLLTLFFAPFLLLASSMKVAIVIRRCKAKNFLLLTQGGFGHTISDPFLFLSLVAGDGAVAVLCQSSSCNPRTPEIFGGKLTQLPSAISVRGRKIYLPFALRRVVQLVAERTCKMSGQIFWDYQSLNAIADDRGYKVLANHSSLGLFFNFAATNGPQRFELTLDKRMATLIAKVGRPDKIAFYVRGKGGGSAQADNALRDGNQLSAYTELIRPFINAGFSILAVGETEKLDVSNLDTRTRNHVFTHKDIGITQEEMNLYAPLCADYFIGNAGGGSLLAVIGQKKSLIVDGFGFWYAIPNALHSLKLVVDESGAIVSTLARLRNNIFDARLPRGQSARFFEPSELRDLGLEFLKEIQSEGPGEVLRGMQPRLAENHWMNFADNSYFAATYLKTQYESE